MYGKTAACRPYQVILKCFLLHANLKGKVVLLWVLLGTTELERCLLSGVSFKRFSAGI